MQFARKIGLVLLSVCLLTLPADAAKGIKVKGLPQVRVATAALSRRIQTASRPKQTAVQHRMPPVLQRKRILNARIERSFKQAQLAVQQNPDLPLLTEEIIPPQPNQLVKAFPLSASHIYPDKPFLKHPILGPQLVQAYFFAQNNRLVLKHLREMKTFLPKFNKAISQFYKEAKALAQPENPLLFTAQSIPDHIQNLFIGEVHGYAEVTQFVRDLLPLLREKHPDSKIFLFTEFLEDPHSGGKNTLERFARYPLKRLYQPIWESAREQNITVVGLEPAYVSSSMVRAITMTGKSIEEMLWATAEGIRVRNEHWWQILEKYRAENPDALFVIYSGSGHSLYNYPFSLATRTPKASTFMLEVVPDKLLIDGERTTKTDNLEMIKPSLSFPQPVLKWTDPHLSRISGFDMRIKVPTDLQFKQILQEQEFLFEETMEHLDRY